MIDVLMLTRSDWANTGYRFSRCLEMLGLRVLFLKGNYHVFGYPKQGHIDSRLNFMDNKYPVKVSMPSFEGLAQNSRVIHFIASTFVNTGINLNEKFVVVQHGGSTYRIEPTRANDVFNNFSDASIIQCPDLLNLGAKNEHLIYYPVDTDNLQPVYKLQGLDEKIRIGHFPSDPFNKGTKTILEVIKKLKNDPLVGDKFEYVGVKTHSGETHRVSWKQNLERMASADVIIETHKPLLDLGGRGEKRFGEWGNTAIEAASLGKSVITNSLSTEYYKKEYGECALHIANDVEALEAQLRKLINMTADELLEDKKKTREWVVKKHSMKATALRLWEKIYSQYFPDKWADEAPNMDNLHTEAPSWCELEFDDAQTLKNINIRKEKA